MKTIDKKSKFIFILFSILTIGTLAGLIWYIYSIYNKYSLVLLIISIVFGLLFIIFLGISINQFRKRNDGLFRNGKYIIIINKGKEFKLNLKDIKDVKYHTYTTSLINFTSGDLYIDNLKITDIKNVRKVASYLINEIDKTSNIFE